MSTKPSQNTTVYLRTQAIDLSGGSALDVSPAGRGIIRYNQGSGAFETSVNGAAYQAIGTGAHILNGSGAPSSGLGANGDLYLDNTNGTYYSKASGSWGSPVTLTAGALSGTLSVGHGGTNSAAALSNNRIMKSSGGAIVEAAAITASRALQSDANGIPVAASVTTTELGYLSGVTSALQTQINGTVHLSGTETITGDKSFTGTNSFSVTSGAAFSPFGSPSTLSLINPDLTDGNFSALSFRGKTTGSSTVQTFGQIALVVDSHDTDGGAFADHFSFSLPSANNSVDPFNPVVEAFTISVDQSNVPQLTTTGNLTVGGNAAVSGTVTFGGTTHLAWDASQNMTFTGDANRTITMSQSSSGAGKSFTWQGAQGAASGTNSQKRGGDINIYPGVPGGTGTLYGTINLGTTPGDNVVIGASSGSGNVSVDAHGGSGDFGTLTVRSNFNASPITSGTFTTASDKNYFGGETTATIGFFGNAGEITPVGRQTVTGDRSGNTGLTSALSKLAAYNLIVDSTTDSNTYTVGSVYGSASASGTLTLKATTNATDGKINFYSSGTRQIAAIGLDNTNYPCLFVPGATAELSGDNGPFGGTAGTGSFYAAANSSFLTYLQLDDTTSALVANGTFSFNSSTSAFSSTAATGSTAMTFNVGSGSTWTSGTIAAFRNHSTNKFTVAYDGALNTAGSLTVAGTSALNSDVTIAASKNLTFAAGAGALDGSAATGTLKWGAGALIVDGNTNIVTLGKAGTATANLGLLGTTSGTVTIQPQAAAGSWNFNLPTSAGTSGQPLLSGGGAGAAQTYGTLGIAAGGTGQTTQTAAMNALSPMTTQGDVEYHNGTNVVRLGTGTNGQLLTSGGAGANLSWTTVTSVSGANPSGTVGLTAVNGSNTTYLRSDGAPALSQSIVPTWTGLHTFNTLVAATSTDGLVVANSTVSDGTTTKRWSPRIRLQGSAWTGSADSIDSWYIENQTTNAATNTSLLGFYYNINNGSYTQGMKIDSTGDVYSGKNFRPTNSVFPTADQTGFCGFSSLRWAVTYSAAYSGLSQNVAPATNVTIGAQSGECARINLNATSISTITLSAGADAEVMTIVFVNDSGGTRTVATTTWSGAKITGAAFANTLTANAVDTITLRYNNLNSTWVEIGRALNLS